jgi:serine/threonine protein kinase
MEAAARTGRAPQLAKYEVLEEIGHGGMATVYRARDKRLGREVAVKVIHPHLRDSREVVSRFNTEAKAVAKLRHPNIVEVFDVSETDEAEQYLVVELLRGTTLRKLLQTHQAMPPEIAAAVALELLGALAHAHGAGVVHRDIKPENVLVEHRGPPSGGDGTSAATPQRGRDAGQRGTPTPHGDRAVVKLTDFGIAKLLDAQGVTSTGQVLGSPAHMAPEQIEGGEVDPRADVFGLGVLLYECMVGHLPFEGNNPAQVLRRVLEGRYPEAQSERPLVGSRWSALLDHALAHVPEERFTDANAMREAISAELTRLGVTTPRRELEAWLDDPEAYQATHTKHMIERLCALAAEERKRGEALAAAADYNRALAHAPDDPQLLRIVAGMNRAEARVRVVKRAAALVAITVGLGALAFGVGKLAQRWHITPDPAATQSTAPVVPSTPSAVVSVEPPASTSPSAHPTVAPPIPSLTVAAVRDAGLPRAVDRTAALDLFPPMGVTMTMDNGAPRDVRTGDAISLNGDPHTLAFSCADDLCMSMTIPVPAGDKDLPVVAHLKIKPATLVIKGDAADNYQILSRPEVHVGAGTNTVAMQRTSEKVTIKQLETNSTQPATLTPGKSVTVVF